jgi:FMN reductase (NADPH)
MISSLFNHRSVRKYKSKPIPEEILDTILEAGTRASNTGNMQVYSIIVTQDSALKQKLWEAHFKQDMVLESPVSLTFCADINRFSKWCKQRKSIPGYDNFLWFCTALTDAVLASQNVAIAAEENGLGICYLGTVMYNAQQIIDILGLPNGVVPVASMVVGYPDEDKGLTSRLPKEGVVHKETYHDYSSSNIDHIYNELDQSDETAALLKINNKETLAQVFTDKRYTKKDNLLFSQEYLKVLKSQGFMNNEK